MIIAWTIAGVISSIVLTAVPAFSCLPCAQDQLPTMENMELLLEMQSSGDKSQGQQQQGQGQQQQQGQPGQQQVRRATPQVLGCAHCNKRLQFGNSR
jgi:hypothetical protein